MPKFYVKLFLEILDDPKMGQLPNHLWRRTIELFLLAGRNGDGESGALQPVEEMQWILRLEKERLLEDLHRLAEVGVVHESEPGKWWVTNFEKRQLAETSTARVRRYRKRLRNEDETKTFQDETEIERELKLKIESEREGGSSADALVRAWEKSTGMMVGAPEPAVHAIHEMLAAGVEPQDIAKAVEEMAAKGMTRFRGIASIVQPAIIARSKRKLNGNKPTPPPRANYEW